MWEERGERGVDGFDIFVIVNEVNVEEDVE